MSTALVPDIDRPLAEPFVTDAPAAQQPPWYDDDERREVRRSLLASAGLVGGEDVLRLRSRLAEVAGGAADVVQAGDCVEDPDRCGPVDVNRKVGLLDVLAGTMTRATGRPTVRAGRIAGQLGKPRSRPTELLDGRELPVFRGHMVNAPGPDLGSRLADPARLLDGYALARDTMEHLGWPSPSAPARVGGSSDVWTSHEALLLDYELPMVRRTPAGLLLASTHWPWIGERTRRVDGAHVDLLSAVINPVACKVGPTIERDELLALCARLDPRREPGRLTLIVRMGADVVAERLSGLVAAVRAAGHPVVWLSDPLHANTRTLGSGHKTRFVHDARREVQAFGEAVRTGGAHPAGVHLETTPDDVLECLDDAGQAEHVGDRYTTLCDPRLNLDQAVSVVSARQA